MTSFRSGIFIVILDDVHVINVFLLILLLIDFFIDDFDKYLPVKIRN